MGNSPYLQVFFVFELHYLKGVKNKRNDKSEFSLQLFNSANSSTGGLCLGCFFAGLGCLGLSTELDNTFLGSFVGLCSLLEQREEGSADHLVAGSLSLCYLESFQICERCSLQKERKCLTSASTNATQLIPPFLSSQYVWPMR